jgi:ABC-type glycerol-3-phosphate transport system permease component
MPRQVVLLGALLLILVPVYFILVTAFKSQENYLQNLWGLPREPALRAFQEALRGGRFFLWFRNSAIFTAFSVLLGAGVSSLAAFAFARMEFRGREFLLNTIISLMVIPPVVMVVPLFVLYTRLDLINTYHGLILIYTGLICPFSVYLLTNFYRTIPHEIVESALMDGASHLRILMSIILPLAAPAYVALVVVNALWVWNELLLALVFLPSDQMKTLMVGITVFQSRYNRDVPVTMAGLLLSALPMLILYLVFQRFFIRGLTAGALRG